MYRVDVEEAERQRREREARLAAVQHARILAEGALDALNNYLRRYAPPGAGPTDFGPGYDLRVRTEADVPIAQQVLGDARQSMAALQQALEPLGLALAVDDVTLEQLDFDSTGFDEESGFGLFAHVKAYFRRLGGNVTLAPRRAARATRERLEALHAQLVERESGAKKDADEARAYAARAQRGGA